MSIYAQTRKGQDERMIPVNEQAPGQVRNNDGGGFVYKAEDFTRLDRWLILGSEKATYYTDQKKNTIENLDVVDRCLAADFKATIDQAVLFSIEGRAPKNDTSIYVIARACADKRDEVRAYAFLQVNKVCRTATHLFQWVAAVKMFRGTGKSVRRAINNWYNSKPAERVAYQMVKYRQREGYTHRDLLRIGHPIAGTSEHKQLFEWICREQHTNDEVRGTAQAPNIGVIQSYEAAKSATSTAQILRLIEAGGLTREMIPTQFLKDASVWDALLPNTPMTGLIRNLANMSASGFLVEGNFNAVKDVTDRLTNEQYLRKGRVHPIKVLAAMKMYASGVNRNNTWKPVQRVISALNEAFYATFQNVEPTGKNFVLGVDVSGSMGSKVEGVENLTCYEAAAAMSLVIAATEPNHVIKGFSGELVDINIDPTMRLDTVLEVMKKIRMGSTRVSAPLEWALANKVDADCFVIISDNEANGGFNPVSVLDKFNREMGKQAKMAAMNMAPNAYGWSNGAENGCFRDVDSSLVMDFVGFDTAVPSILSNFVRD